MSMRCAFHEWVPVGMDKDLPLVNCISWRHSMSGNMRTPTSPPCPPPPTPNPTQPHLQAPEGQEVSGPRAQAVHVTKHNGGGGGQTHTMCCRQYTMRQYTQHAVHSSTAMTSTQETTSVSPQGVFRTVHVPSGAQGLPDSPPATHRCLLVLQGSPVACSAAGWLYPPPHPTPQPNPTPDAPVPDPCPQPPLPLNANTPPHLSPPPPATAGC
jgi:hypothetical protein